MVSRKTVMRPRSGARAGSLLLLERRRVHFVACAKYSRAIGENTDAVFDFKQRLETNGCKRLFVSVAKFSDHDRGAAEQLCKTIWLLDFQISKAPGFLGKILVDTVDVAVPPHARVRAVAVEVVKQRLE